VWPLDDILHAVQDGLRSREAELREEQAVAGLDSLDELALHPLVAASLEATPFGVLREQVYPSEWQSKRGSAKRPSSELIDQRTGEVVSEPLPERRDRYRCDIVLTPERRQRLVDPLVITQRARREQASALGGLFDVHARREAEPPVQGRDIDSDAAIEPEFAFWLEVKQVAQCDLSSGVPGFSRSYASRLVQGPAADLGKLQSDDRVQHGAALLVLFTASKVVADHDVPIMLHRLLDRGRAVSSPMLAGFDITDRLGNGRCTLVLLPFRRSTHG
jgi:hypothetical protein